MGERRHRDRRGHRPRRDHSAGRGGGRDRPDRGARRADQRGRGPRLRAGAARRRARPTTGAGARRARAAARRADDGEGGLRRRRPADDLGLRRASRTIVATEDAVAVQRLKAAGAVILGKTNVPLASPTSRAYNPIYGRTDNPCTTSAARRAAPRAARRRRWRRAWCRSNWAPTSAARSACRPPLTACGGTSRPSARSSVDGHYFPRHRRRNGADGRDRPAGAQCRRSGCWRSTCSPTIRCRGRKGGPQANGACCC